MILNQGIGWGSLVDNGLFRFHEFQFGFNSPETPNIISSSVLMFVSP